jgi:hypothetical protein
MLIAMKHLFRIYAVLFLLMADFKIFAQVGDDDEDGELEGGDDPAVPINGKIVFLAIVGILFAYYKYKTHQKLQTEQ